MVTQRYMTEDNENEVSEKMIHIHLPGDSSRLFDELKEVRAKNLETTSYTSIVIDALKAYHKNRVKK